MMEGGGDRETNQPSSQPANPERSGADVGSVWMGEGCDCQDVPLHVSDPTDRRLVWLIWEWGAGRRIGRGMIGWRMEGVIAGR